MNMIQRSVHDAAVSRTGLRVTMLGLRGFPNVQGGVERHVEHLARELTAIGCHVEAILRTPYIDDKARRTWQGIDLYPMWSPRRMGVEPFVHTLLGVLRAGWTRPDVLHIHGIGPALFTPLARALGLNVVVTHHMANYENEKWSAFGRALLRLGERVSMKLSHGRIAVSLSLANRMSGEYHVDVRTIPNGIVPPRPATSRAILGEFGLTPRRYFVTVARIDQQKRQLDLIEAFAKLGPTGWKLALVGGADYNSEYTRTVDAAARETPGVVMLGARTGDELAAMYANAGAFVLPSSHEGQPIAVLEALSYGCRVVLSDIPAHTEIGCRGARYFTPGDIDGLATQLHAVCTADEGATLDEAERARIVRAHNWRRIAEDTLAVYDAALTR
jgi:glycosyltransferase involved in cell wall biosynthesis